MKCRKTQKGYPPEVYRGITDDESTWGMCCSKEMAYRCAEEYWDSTHTYSFSEKLFLSFLIFLSVICFLCISFVISVFLSLIAFYYINPITYTGIFILMLYLGLFIFCMSKLIKRSLNGFDLMENFYSIFFGITFLLGFIITFIIKL